MHRLPVLALLALAACSWETKVKRLSDTEFAHYYALKPFMDDEDRKAFLTRKTEDERNAYLKSNGCRDVLGTKECYWDRFYKFDEKQRSALVEGDVKTGWTKEMLYMSWGAPYDRRSLAGRPAQRSELLLYKFEKHDDGSVLVYEPGSKTEYKAIDRFRREVYVDNDVVTEIVERQGWSN